MKTLLIANGILQWLCYLLFYTLIGLCFYYIALKPLSRALFKKRIALRTRKETFLKIALHEYHKAKRNRRAFEENMQSIDGYSDMPEYKRLVNNELAKIEICMLHMSERNPFLEAEAQSLMDIVKGQHLS